MTILEQWEKSCNDCESKVICPDCHKEVGQYYANDSAAAALLDAGKCPFCDCVGVAEYEYRFRLRCDDCDRKRDCEEECLGANDFAVERSRELFRYQCTGNLSRVERIHTNW